MALRILVAEDEYVTALDLCETFKEAGYEVEGPHAGISSVMFACQKKRPDLAILDSHLIDGSTIALAQKLIAENVPVILHAERAEQEAIAAHLPQVFTLAKPCPPADLLTAVGRVLATA